MRQPEATASSINSKIFFLSSGKVKWSCPLPVRATINWLFFEVSTMPTPQQELVNLKLDDFDAGLKNKDIRKCF